MENDFYRFISAMGKASMAERRKNGERMHLAPLGWRNTRDEFGRSMMEKDPEVWPLIEEALRLKEEGASVRTICSVMYYRGLRSKRGKKVGPSAMHRLLSVDYGFLPGFASSGSGPR